MSFAAGAHAGNGGRARLAAFLLVVLLIGGPWTAPAGTDTAASPWFGTDAAGRPTVTLFFFWTETCPHCRRAKPFVDELEKDWPWLAVRSLRLAADTPDAVALFLAMTEALGEHSPGVPTFAFCGRLLVGFDTAESTGAELRQGLSSCRDRLAAASPEAVPAPPEPVSVDLPLFGAADPQSLSLPVFTVMIAAVDAFNPCAFFVLMFLMSVLAHARDRRRMAVVGGIFVLTSGFLYFAFMAAWLNVFLVIGELRWITIAAGLLAVGLAAINIKDFFWLKAGISLSIPEAAKPGLFARMRALTAAQQGPLLLLGAVSLAIAANSYELLCTAGFPMLFTRVLTLHALSPAAHYLYLALYTVVYVTPLLAIATLFVVTLGARKLQTHEGRALKLLSGLMMLGLGGALLLAPAWLTDVRAAAGLIAAAIIATAVCVVIDRRLAPG